MRHLVLFLVAAIGVSVVNVDTVLASKKKKYKSVQEVNLDGDSVDGIVRNPYGAYLSQKRGVQFMPLYQVRETFDQNIKESVEYLK